MNAKLRHYRLFDTAFGICGVAWTNTGLSRVQLPERDVLATEQLLQRTQSIQWDEPPPPNSADSITKLQRYFDGQKIDFSNTVLAHDELTDFNRRIFAALRMVEYGQTTTYGALAQSAGSPGAAQAVGMAMSRNPWPVIVPCHRVLAAAKTIGGFSAYGGMATKQRLLRLEGVDLDHGQPTLPGL
jgi:methylated-DNA-[protein]-cysteine S-methyltransferase